MAAEEGEVDSCGDDECSCDGCDEEAEMEQALASKWYEYPPIRNALLAGVLVGIIFTLSNLISLPWYASVPAYAFAVVLGGFYWIKEGVYGLWYGRKIGINILMLAATLGAAVLGLWEEAAFLAFLYGAAEGVEEYTYARTRGSIRALMDLVPQEANVLRDGVEVRLPASELQVEDVLFVRPGESIATDGIVLKGESSIDESAVTGESIPMVKREGMQVFAGSLNLDGALKIRATSSFADNTVSKIIHLVEEAQERKGKAQQFIDRFGDLYSPVILAGGLFLMIVPYLMGWDSSFWFERAVVFLVAAAPCALVMSTPVTIAAGIGQSGKKGILIKGGIHLEALGKISVVAFDKTGTLTKGRPEVTDIIPLDGTSESILRMACAVENGSEHPIARALIAKGTASDIEAMVSQEFRSQTGSGASALIGGIEYSVGRPEMFTGRSNLADGLREVERLQMEGKTVVFVGTAKGILGAIALKDQVRPEAKKVVQELRATGMKVVMLTGDNERTANSVAKELGIDEVRANLKPGDKTAAIRELRSRYGAVAMVGDGINDAPALAEASVGIAMGVAGTDAAIEAADVALMADDLEKVSAALNIGKRVNIINRQNIAFSLLVLAVLIPSALFGVLSLAAAVVLHESSELIAVGNGLRARM